MLRTFAWDIAIGGVAGLIATRVSDRAQSLLLLATPASERAREPRVREDSSARAVARLLLERTGTAPEERQLNAARNVVHYGLGMSWGPVYCLLRRGSGMTPAGAGFVTGAALSLLVDETLNPLLGATPPSREFPVSAHARGFVTHLVWGLTAAAAAEALHRCSDCPPPR